MASIVHAQGAPTYPVDLPTVLRLADAQNLDIRIASERVKEAQANRVSALEQFMPWLSPGINWRRRDGVAQAMPSGTIGSAAFGSSSPGIGLTAQAQVGDAMYAALSAKQLVHASEEGLSAQRSDIALRAAEGYFDLAKATALESVMREALATSEEYQKELHEAVAVGIAFRGDELRIQSQSERLQLTVRQAQAQRRLAAVELARLLHLDPTVELVVAAGDLVPLALLDSSLAVEALVSRALATRPEIRQSQSLLGSSRANREGSVYGPLFPAIGLQLFDGRLSGGPDSARSKSGPVRDVAIGLSWRIGPGGLFDSGRIAAAKAQVANRELSDRRMRDVVSAEVVAAHTRVRALSDQISLAARALATSTEALRLTRARKQFGVGLVLEDIQAQQAVMQARAEYLSAIAEYNKSQYALRRAVGPLAADTASRP